MVFPTCATFVPGLVASLAADFHRVSMVVAFVVGRLGSESRFFPFVG